MTGDPRFPVEPVTSHTQTRPRLVLAGAVALLAHVIVGVTLALQPPEPDPERRVQIQLVAQGSDAAASPQASEPSASQPQHAEPVKPSEPQPSEQTSDADPAALASTQSPSQQQTPQARPDKKDSGTADASAEQPASRHTDATPNREVAAGAEAAVEQPPADAEDEVATASEAPGADAPPSEVTETDQVYQQSTRPDAPEVDPYRLALSRQLLRPLKRTLSNRQTLEQFNQAVEAGTQPITIELRLLSNGAVRRVQVKESSGSDLVDRVAVQSALAASPYPPPPEEERKNGFRFNLNLVMSPVYL